MSPPDHRFRSNSNGSAKDCEMSPRKSEEKVDEDPLDESEYDLVENKSQVDSTPAPTVT